LSVFLSCTKENTSDLKSDENTIYTNLQSYSKEYINIAIDIDRGFAKNSRISFDEKLKNSLNSAKNETDIKIALENAGVNNSNEIIFLLKKKISIQNNFRKQNPNFYKLDLQKRNELFNEVFDSTLNNFIEAKNTISSLRITSCAGTYNTSVSRCNKTYYKCGGLAIIAAADGIVPGLLVGVFCAWDLSDCKSYALDDYNSCMN
jgi:hypothetical protein